MIVVTGAIFPANAQTIGPGAVAVPSHLYKVVLVNERGRARMFAAIIPNAETSGRSLDEFLVTIAEVERRTGLTFFPSLGQRVPRATEPGIIIAPASVADLPARASEIERRDAPPTAAPDHAGNSPLDNVSSQI